MSFFSGIRIAVLPVMCGIVAGMFMSACVSAKVREYRAEVVGEYPHDPAAYTQGLFFNDGQLYESTGTYGRSSFRKVDLTTGKVLEKIDFSKKYFIEGSAMMGGNLYLLTWTSKVAFIYDAATLEYVSTYSYPRQGWGLTTDGTRLIASDGSSTLYFMDGAFSVTRRLTVRLNGRPMRLLNELEYVDGKIWANVYTADLILIIDPATGNVEATVDASGLLPAGLRTEDTDVLNGIAYDEKTGKIYLTGKNWPRRYEIRLTEK